jgi:hypothetical protein
MNGKCLKIKIFKKVGDGIGRWKTQLDTWFTSKMRARPALSVNLDPSVKIMIVSGW